MSNQLIPVFQGNIQQESVQLVDARVLHQFLEVEVRFNDWITRRISEYEFIENQDFIIFTQKRVKIQRGRPSVEYHITLDMAKELSMVERNEQGRLARRYFIACEKALLTKQLPKIEPETITVSRMNLNCLVHHMIWLNNFYTENKLYDIFEALNSDFGVRMHDHIKDGAICAYSFRKDLHKSSLY